MQYIWQTVSLANWNVMQISGYLVWLWGNTECTLTHNTHDY